MESVRESGKVARENGGVKRGKKAEGKMASEMGEGGDSCSLPEGEG